MSSLFVIRCSREIFSETEIELLENHGARLERLADGRRPPGNAAGRRFVDVANGRRRPETVYEKTWMKYLRRLEWERDPANRATMGPLHEYLHVDDFIRFDSCAPWETSAGQAAMRDAGYTASDFNKAGFEKWVRVRSSDEYRNVFGVRAPQDPEYVSGKHNKPLSCLFAQ